MKATSKQLTKCSNCNKDIEVFAYKYKPGAHLFCGQKCYKQYRSEHSVMDMICPVCNKIFKKNIKFVAKVRKQKPTAIFCCSTKCQNITQTFRTSPTKGHIYSEYHDVPCEYCKILFKVTTAHINRKKKTNSKMYCSKICYNKHKYENSIINIKCTQCDKEFETRTIYYNKRVKKDKNTKFYCSKLCHNKAMTIHEHGFSTLYNYKCDYCGKDIVITGYTLERTKHPIHFCCRKHQGRYLLLLGAVNKTRSILEEQLQKHIKEYNSKLDIIFNDRTVCNGYELDVYIPSYKLAIEINGPPHFKPIWGIEQLNEIQRRDTVKQQTCEKLGIKLLVITDVFDYTTDNSKIIFDNYIKPELEKIKDKTICPT